jgi:hypothetical protein
VRRTLPGYAIPGCELKFCSGSVIRTDFLPYGRRLDWAVLVHSNFYMDDHSGPLYLPQMRIGGETFCHQIYLLNEATLVSRSLMMKLD